MFKLPQSNTYKRTDFGGWALLCCAIAKGALTNIASSITRRTFVLCLCVFMAWSMRWPLSAFQVLGGALPASQCFDLCKTSGYFREARAGFLKSRALPIHRRASHMLRRPAHMFQLWSVLRHPGLHRPAV